MMRKYILVVWFREKGIKLEYLLPRILDSKENGLTIADTKDIKLLLKGTTKENLKTI